MDELSLLTITLTLLCIMDPLGNLSTVLYLTEGIAPRKQKTILLREMGFALAVMLLFNLIGEYLLDYLELSAIAVRLSAGAILFLVAIRTLFPNSKGLRHNLPKGEPYLIPLAIPLIAGPSLLATIMLYADMETCGPMMLSAILISWMICVVIILSAPYLCRLLGQNGLTACERLMAMVLIMLAIQRIADGVHDFILQRP